MGARPLRRAIQRYIEDPLADFVLRQRADPGGDRDGRRQEPAEDGDDREVSIKVIQPGEGAKKPVAVGADDGDGDDDEGGVVVDRKDGDDK